MSRSSLVRLAALVAGLVFALGLAQRAPGSARAQSGAFAIDWYSIDGGGQTTPITANGYTLSGTIGQPDTGFHATGGYTLQDGFWAGIDPRYLGFAPLVER